MEFKRWKVTIAVSPVTKSVQSVIAFFFLHYSGEDPEYIYRIAEWCYYRSVPLVLVTLLCEYPYSADLPWLPKFKKKIIIFFWIFFFWIFFHLSNQLFTKLLHVICFAKTLLFTLGINNACLINLLLL